MEHNNVEETTVVDKKRRRSTFLWGFGAAALLGVLLVVCLPLIIGAIGVVDVAQASLGQIDWFASWGTMRSIAFHAPNKTNPFANNPQAIDIGLGHYKENCLVCHGAPGVDAAELAEGLNPSPPDLTAKWIQSMSDGELFWTIKHGIRLTAMPAFKPTHADPEIWRIVSFVRHLPNLTPEEKAKLSAGMEAQEAHHHMEMGSMNMEGEAGHDAPHDEAAPHEHEHADEHQP